jgi:hypothetical protein
MIKRLIPITTLVVAGSSMPNSSNVLDRVGITLTSIRIPIPIIAPTIITG